MKKYKGRTKATIQISEIKTKATLTIFEPKMSLKVFDYPAVEEPEKT